MTWELLWLFFFGYDCVMNDVMSSTSIFARYIVILLRSFTLDVCGNSS